MFDISFVELMLVALVALIVIGPERLPKVARTAGHLLGRLQRYVSDVKSDISREMQIEDLKKLQEQVQEQARDLERQVNEQMQTIDAGLNQSILESVENRADAPTKADASTGAAKPFAPSHPVVAPASANPPPTAG